ncbi:hypothetical protein [Rhizobacter sp. OV335]|uniref:hypothetical protein n=1 Tax=Rhizobacter sp. OV335 TaxID=1500264 RepID=UPI00092472A3|nr:hypothetical protein [Rhizobacter sp. OV335]SHN08903.1 hypothetical protein SAMN02787076_03248 [Rhizobacter sp. OV335]
MANQLKAGQTDNMADSLAQYIDTAMHNEWKLTKGEELPDKEGAEDRQILFAAIAQGVLKFLEDHRVDLITTDDSGDSGMTTHHHAMAFTVGTYRPDLP